MLAEFYMIVHNFEHFVIKFIASISKRCKNLAEQANNSNNYKTFFSLLLQGLLSEIEVKYKMSQCYVHLKEYREATAIVCEAVFFPLD